VRRSQLAGRQNVDKQTLYPGDVSGCRFVTPIGISSPKYLRWSLETMGAERIMHASDHPFNLERAGSARRFLEEAPASHEDRGRIAHRNREELVAGIRRRPVDVVPAGPQVLYRHRGVSRRRGATSERSVWWPTVLCALPSWWRSWPRPSC
jgi:hypothetical protein